MTANLRVRKLTYHKDRQGSTSKTLRSIENYYVLNVSDAWFLFIVLKTIE